MDGLVGFLKGQTRGQLVGLLLVEIGVFLFIGVLTAQGGVYQQKVDSCKAKFGYFEALRKYSYASADSLCADVVSGKFQIPP